MTIKNNENSQQQQIIFSESDSVTEQDKGQFKESELGSIFTEQVLFDNDTYLPAAIDENGLDELRKMEFNDEQLSQDIELVQGGKRSWLWRTVGALFGILLAIEAVEFFIVGFEQSPIITSLYGLLLASLTLISGNYLWREFIGLRQFKSRQKMKQQATEL